MMIFPAGFDGADSSAGVTRVVASCRLVLLTNVFILLCIDAV